MGSVANVVCEIFYYFVKKGVYRCFPVNFAKFLRTTFSQSNSEYFLLLDQRI